MENKSDRMMLALHINNFQFVWHLDCSAVASLAKMKSYYRIVATKLQLTHILSQLTRTTLNDSLVKRATQPPNG